MLDALLFDPQTSGGLLVLVAEDAVEQVLAAVPGARRVGRAEEAGPYPLAIA